MATKQRTLSEAMEWSKLVSAYQACEGWRELAKRLGLPVANVQRRILNLRRSYKTAGKAWPFKNYVRVRGERPDLDELAKLA